MQRGAIKWRNFKVQRRERERGREPLLAFGDNDYVRVNVLLILPFWKFSFALLSGAVKTLHSG